MKQNCSLTRIVFAISAGLGAGAFLALPASVPAFAATTIVNDVSVSASSGGGTSLSSASVRTEVNGQVVEDTHVATSSGSIHVEQHIVAEDGKPVERRSSVTYPVLPPPRLPDPPAITASRKPLPKESHKQADDREAGRVSTSAPREGISKGSRTDQQVRRPSSSDTISAARSGRTSGKAATASVRKVLRAEEALAVIKKFFIHVVLFVRA